MTGIRLDAGARKALDVALGTAGAMGDERCGTEYVLFGIVATASDELREICDLFALDTMRIERGIQALRGHRFDPHPAGKADPPLSTRAEMAVHRPSIGANATTSAFDLLLGCVSDPRSGASTVLRHLGVRVAEIRRLVELGAACLDRSEVEGLIAALDRRRTGHHPWWGPSVDASVARIGLADGVPMVIATSKTAEATLDTVVAGPDGFGMTISIASRDTWILPPSWEPGERLVPGVGSEHRLVPEMVTIDVAYVDGTVVSNRGGGPRYRSDVPTPGTLVRLGTRRVVEDRNDRRRPARHVESTEWWVWPLPLEDRVRVTLKWSAEALSGVVELDGSEIRNRADTLRAAT